MERAEIEPKEWEKVLQLHKLFKKINDSVIRNYNTASPVDIVNLIINDSYGTLSDGLVTIYADESSETRFSLRMHNYSGATTYHTDFSEMPQGNGGFLKFASTLKEPEYITDISELITDSDIELLPWIATMHTALIVPTIGITSEKATTIILGFDKDAFDTGTIKHMSGETFNAQSHF